MNSRQRAACDSAAAGGAGRQLEPPLVGLRVIAVEQYGAGPFGTQHLADLGAEVIKIENPLEGGDVARSIGPHHFGPGDSQLFPTALQSLAGEADAVFNNLRGDLPAKLGLTYEHLKAVNPSIICAHLSAYGRTGSRAVWPGYDYLMQAEAGYLTLTGEPGGPHERMGLSLVDLMTGTTAAMGLLAGVLSARATGAGRDIDVSLFDVALHNLTYVGTWYLNAGAVTRREPRSAHPSVTPCQLFRMDDGWIFIMCNKEKFWRALCDLVGRPEWKSDPLYQSMESRLAHRERLTGELGALLQRYTTAAWMARFAGKVPASPVNDVAQALDNPFVAEQGRLLEFDHPVQPVRMVASQVRAGRHPTRAAPALGADTEPVLRAAGANEQEARR